MPRNLSSIVATAQWVAYYRAQESERHDAIFRDPFARELAGDTGRRMATLDQPARPIAWAVIVERPSSTASTHAQRRNGV